MEDSDKRNLAKLIAISAVAWVSYKIIKGLNKEEPIEKIVKEIVTEPVAAVVAVPETIIKKAAHLIKGSPEAKAYMANLRHKGHSTKKGLSQDQKLLSDEPHEKFYRKQKYMSEHSHKKKHKHFLFTLS